MDIKSQNIIEFTESDQKQKRTVRLIVKFKGFVPRAKVYRARKHKAAIAIHLDLTKRRYLLLKHAYGKAKDCASVDFACADINFSSVYN